MPMQLPLAASARRRLSARVRQTRSVLALSAAWLAAGAGCFGSTVRVVDPRLGRVPPGTDLNRDAYLVESEPAEYPTELRSALVEGYVYLDFAVDAQGTVSDVQVLGSDPAGLFEPFAIAAAQQWRYSPKVVAGQPVASRTDTIVAFCMEDDELPAGQAHARACQGSEQRRSIRAAIRERLQSGSSQAR
jgi:TonB family protein